MQSTKPCKFPNCPNPTASSKRQYCSGHDAQLRSGRPLLPLRAYSKATQDTCAVEQCKRECAGEYCQNHRSIAWRMGIHPSELSALYATGCLICGTTSDLNIDHDHACCPNQEACGSCVRGALCSSCNIRVGHYEKDLDRVQRTLDYVLHQPRQTELRKSEAKVYTKMHRERFIRVDAKGRLSIGRYTEGNTEFAVDIAPDGVVTLTPIPA